MATPGTIKRYIPNGYSFTEDVNGHVYGIEWTKGNGNSFRVVITHADNFNILDKTVSFTFLKEMKEEGEVDWFLRNKFILDKTEYINVNWGNAKYGKTVSNPFELDGITLKPNTKSFVNYFFDVLYMQLDGRPPIQLALTLCDIAATKENVTLP